MARKKAKPDDPASPPAAGPASPARAEALLAEAEREREPERRLELALATLAAWPDCAGAYALLAEQAGSRKEAVALYEKGVAAGERAIGPEGFRQHAGRFWLVPETRPYMSLRLELAQLLWTLGRRDEAVQHLQDLLKLNPDDNQGVRYTLLGFLLFLDRDDEADRLIARYADDASAAWAYTRALLAFRRQRDVIESRRLLKAARKANKHVPPYLLGLKFPPDRLRNSYRPGDATEAAYYVSGFLAAWKSTPGAVAWLRANAADKRKAEAPKAKGPLPAIKTSLKRLPQKDDVWQADFRRTANWIELGGERVRPWLVLVMSVSEGTMLAHEVSGQEPSADLLWDVLARAMQHPAMGRPHRPAEIQVRPDGPWEAMRPHVEEMGVRLTAADEPAEAASVLQELSDQIGGEAEPGLLDAPGVTPEMAGRFYEAAADFFRQAPWKKVGYESAIRVECGRFSGGPWYAVLMGQSGLTVGMALYDDLQKLERMWTGGGDDEENARETVATTVTFGEESEIPVADLEAARRHGWPVARPDAYPSVFRKERGLTTRPPLAWELGLMEACLRAVPEFVSRRRQDDATRDERTVASSAGELKMALSWAADGDGAGALPPGVSPG